MPAGYEAATADSAGSDCIKNKQIDNDSFL